MVVYLVIFGAAVRADGGSPSGSLRRRCENAVRISHDYAATCFLVTGGVGRHGPAEALVMRDLLVERGVAPARIVLETAARDTLESVRCCSRLLRERAPTPSRSWSVRAATTTCAAHCCSGWPGFRTESRRTPSERPHLGTAKWLRHVLKECLAIPWDVTFLLALDVPARA